jgi:glycerol-3-phosphate acyltransferase PlsX
VALKMAEGTGELFRNLGTWAFKQSLLWKLGLLLLSSGLRRLKDLTDYSELRRRAAARVHAADHQGPRTQAARRRSATRSRSRPQAARDGVCTDIAACARDFAAKQAQA